MKKLLFFALVAFALSGCTHIIGPKQAVHIYNSAWQEIDPNAAAKAIAKDAVSLDAVSEYNATHTDDAWMVYYGDPVTIDEAPDAPIFIVNSATLAVYFSATIPRTDLVTRREACRSSVEAMADPATGKLISCTLYVDHIPPEPPIITPPAPRLWTALVDITAGVIYYSIHYDTEADAQYQYKLLQSQAELNNLGLGDGNGKPGDLWYPYLGETEYTFNN
jgi:Prokaryotic membrane lipoprotein lipid attachment site